MGVRPKHKTHDYSHSLIDMMTSIAVIFILLAGYMSNKAAKKIKSIDEKGLKINDFREVIINELSKTLNVNGVTIDKDPNDPSLLLIRIKDTALRFKESSSEIDAEYQGKSEQVLGELSASFINLLTNTNYKNGIESIIVEGHTSDTGLLPNNIKISQSRSANVLQKIIENMIAGREDNEDGRELTKKLSSTGLWWNKPLPDSKCNYKDFAKGRDNLDYRKCVAPNQRVEIKIRIIPLAEQISVSSASVNKSIDGLIRKE